MPVQILTVTLLLLIGCATGSGPVVQQLLVDDGLLLASKPTPSPSTVTEQHLQQQEQQQQQQLTDEEILTKEALTDTTIDDHPPAGSDVSFPVETIEVVSYENDEEGSGLDQFKDQAEEVADHQQQQYALLKENVKKPFSVPFITDALSTQVRDCDRGAELDDLVRVVDIPSANLKNLKHRLVRNRLYDNTCTTPSCMVCPHGREGDCRVVGTVYPTTCSECKEEYIGKTGTPLRVSVKEHADGLNKCKVSTPLGEHRLRMDSGTAIGVEVTVLACESDIAARKTLEALWIAFKNPAINRKEERVAIIQKLAPFADLCGLHL
ncbi:unnamed protein product [Heligmosomoides polygyrus]|uniref:Kazal-like domain-containing protein n=1 Tax=Heligmosomoides polygyrus TaxID=6339 RepID=A0A3P8ACQ3_HELPZ|nr:unnamed protein product [Heligmosomoides polygyrus]